MLFLRQKTSRERVALTHEELRSYDSSDYETGLVRSVESVLSLLGWDCTASGESLPKLET